jgi:hypothetical protein
MVECGMHEVRSAGRKKWRCFTFFEDSMTVNKPFLGKGDHLR